MKAYKDARAVIIRDRKVFLIRRSGYCDYWELLGGTPPAGQADPDFLERRAFDWLNGTKLKDDFRYYKEFTGNMGGKQLLRSDVYFREFDGAIRGVKKANWQMAWMGYDDRGKYGVAELTGKIIEGLHKDGLF